MSAQAHTTSSCWREKLCPWREPRLQPHFSLSFSILTHYTRDSYSLNENQRSCHLLTISLPLIWSALFLPKSGFTLNSCTFQKVPNTQRFHFQTPDSDFCLTNNHSSRKGSIVVWHVTITTLSRGLVDTKTANFNAKDFQQGGCQLWNPSVLKAGAPTSLSAYRVLLTACLFSCSVIFLAAQMNVVRDRVVDFFF